MAKCSWNEVQWPPRQSLEALRSTRGAATALAPDIIAAHLQDPDGGLAFSAYDLYLVSQLYLHMLGFYPSIDTDEFVRACIALEKRCHDNLEGTSWLSVKWTGQELQIREARLRPDLNPADQTVGEHEAIAIDDGHPVIGSDMEDDDDDDDHVVRKPPRVIQGYINIDFSITLSPTYSVPVLWFDAFGVSSLDHVYQLLVASHLRDSIQEVGVLGGISQAYHPVTGLPSYFIHPCNTHEALQAVHNGQELTPETYLLVWLGIIGSAVGLHVPSTLVLDVK